MPKNKLTNITKEELNCPSIKRITGNKLKEENWEGNNWKGEKASKSAKHKWLDSHFGKPLTCENPYCEGKSKKFEWCIKK